MIKYISGDILQSKDEYIAQGVAVGSQEGLGTGLAFKLSSQFPEIQKLFKKYTRNTKFQCSSKIWRFSRIRFLMTDCVI